MELSHDMLDEGQRLLNSSTQGDWYWGTSGNGARLYLSTDAPNSRHDPELGVGLSDEDAALIVWLQEHASELISAARSALVLPPWSNE